MTFMPENLLPSEPYTRNLQTIGVEVLYGQLHVNAELDTIGPRLDLAILSHRTPPAAGWTRYASTRPQPPSPMTRSICTGCVRHGAARRDRCRGRCPTRARFWRSTAN